MIDELDWLGLYPEIWKIAEQTYSAAWKVDKQMASDLLMRAKNLLNRSQVSDSVKVETTGIIERHLADVHKV